MKTKHVLVGIGLFLLILASCSQLVGPSSTEQSTIQKATLSVETDLSRSQGVYVNEKGARFDIVSEEGEQGDSVNCVEALKIVEMEQEPASPAAGLFSAKHQNQLKALVLGRRHDGFPGLWLIFNDDGIHAVEDNEEGGKSSKLAETKELNWLLHGIFGWVYHAQTVLGPDSQGGFIIVGYAENTKGFDLGRWEIEPGTTVAVYWRLLPNPHGFFHLSRARIIGQPSAAYAKHWKEIDKEFHGKSYRHHLNRFLHSIFSSFRLFFLDWFDLYLTGFTKAMYDGQKDVYLVTGPVDGPAVKKEGQIGTATITLDGIITIALEQMSEPVYERIVIETYKYTPDAANVDTYLRLYDAAGKLLDKNDNISTGNLFSRIDYLGPEQKGIQPGTYYIKIDSEVSETTPYPNIGPYVIRALSLKLTDDLTKIPYVYPGSPAIETYPDGDDDPVTGNMTTTPKDLPLGSYLNRYLTTSPDHVPPPYDVDWCVLELPKLP